MREPVHVGDPAEVLTFDVGDSSIGLHWKAATVVRVEDVFIVFETAPGRQPAYGYDDEGRAWRRGRSVACPKCSGTGRVPASENG